MSDEEWASVARGARDALDLLGYHVEPRCLPDEPDPCGGTFAQHAMAALGTIKAVADHHLGHLGPLGAQHGLIYWNVRDELDRDDREDANERR